MSHLIHETNTSSKRWLFLVLVATVGALVFVGGAVGRTHRNARAEHNEILADFVPGTGGGIGRAVAFDPRTRLLYYTVRDDPTIYVVTTDNHPVGQITPLDPTTGKPVAYGALAWDAKRQVLWGGRYSAVVAHPPGAVDEIGPTLGTHTVVPQFQFGFPSGDSCFIQPAGEIDGLAYDEGLTTSDSDDSLWISDDGAKHFYHVTIGGGVIGTFAVPALPGLSYGCNSGIASNNGHLWLALLNGEFAPREIVRVAKADPERVLSKFTYRDGTGFGAGPEDMEFDGTTFAGSCALWVMRAETTHLRAYRVGKWC